MTSIRPYEDLRRYRAAASDSDSDSDSAIGDEAIHELAVQLAAIDPQTAPPDGDLLDAVRIHLDLRRADENHPDPLAWADYGHRTAQTLHGPAPCTADPSSGR